MVYMEDRFRDITLEDAVGKIRGSKLYDFQKNFYGEEIIRSNERSYKPIELWDGRTAKGFLVHHICIGRMAPTLPPTSEGEVGIEDEVVLQELSKLFEVKPTKVRFMNGFDDNLFFYDYLTPEKEGPMERLKVSISKRALR